VTILRELLERVVATMAEGTEESIRSGEGGPQMLEGMLHRQAEVAVANRSLVAVYLRDSANLSVPDLRDLRHQQRLLVNEWMTHFGAAAPSVNDDELRTVVQAAFALLNSAATYENPLPDAELIDSMSRMAVATMRAGLGLTAGG
jgi:hypothetical protein